MALVEDHRSASPSAHTVVVIEIEGKPVPKGRHRYDPRFPHFHPEQKTENYENALRWYARRAMVGRKPFDGPLKMTLTATLAVPKSWSKRDREAALIGLILPTGRPDLDNYEKIASDALNNLVYLDDAQIVRIESAKVYGEKPGMLIEIAPIAAYDGQAYQRSRRA